MSQRIANIADNRASFIDFTTAASKPQAGGGSEGGRVAAQTGLARQIGLPCGIGISEVSRCWGFPVVGPDTYSV